MCLRLMMLHFRRAALARRLARCLVGHRALHFQLRLVFLGSLCCRSPPVAVVLHLHRRSLVAHCGLAALVVALREVLLASRCGKRLFLRCCGAVSGLLKLQRLGFVASRRCSAVGATGDWEGAHAGAISTVNRDRDSLTRARRWQY